MEFGAQVGCYRNTWDNIRDSVETMEKGSWNSVWFADHYLPPPGRKEEEPLTAHEGFTVLAAVAGFTKRLKMGHMVLGNTYRNPGLTAKMAGTVDHISHGRFCLALGAAWFEREHEAYGWDFPVMKERQDRLEEACCLLRQLFRSDAPVTFEGKYYQIRDAPLSPGSYDKPIPILIGGTGPTRTLKTLAMYGDVMNLDGWSGRPMTASYFREIVALLDRHCENVGRDPAEIKKTVLMPTLVTNDKSAAHAFLQGRLGEGTAAGTKNYVIDRIGEIVKAGATEIMLGGLDTTTPEIFEEIDKEILSAF